METGKKGKRIILWIVCSAVLLAVAGGTSLFLLLDAKSDKDGMLYVRPGMTEDAFSDTLASRFGERLADKVMLLMKIRGVDLGKRVGAYKVGKGANAFDVWRMVSAGAQTPVRFTFNNLRTVEEFAEEASRQLAMERDALLPLLTDSAACGARGFSSAAMPAMLIPDTYEVYWSVSPEALLDKLGKAYGQFWNDARRKKAAELGLSPEEVATLASIVDSETAYKPEKGAIARLYLNRLKKGMLLQSDPTVKFAVGDAGLKRILGRHLAVESPYNTYRVAGLPPGPIRLPEKYTLDAVLDAPENDYLYMCAKEDFSGSHRFTGSYDVHLQNARKYQRELNGRGIN